MVLDVGISPSFPALPSHVWASVEIYIHFRADRGSPESAEIDIEAQGWDEAPRSSNPGVVQMISAFTSRSGTVSSGRWTKQ